MNERVYQNTKRLVLGTAQFGMNYGISNKRGKVPEDEVFDILNIAIKFGVNKIDTAYLYGDSENVLGRFIQKHDGKFKIISKLPECDKHNVKTFLECSLERLGIEKLYGYLIHSFSTFLKNPDILDALVEFKSKGLIEKFGFSLYYPDELEHILNAGIKFDLVQLPYNIFDRRFEPYFPKLKSAGVELHIRSVFLQGLVFKKPDELKGFFDKIKPKIERLNLLSENFGVPIVAMCINFALLNENVDGVVFGVDNLSNFIDVINSLQYFDDVAVIYEILNLFGETDERIILPINWKS